MAADATPAEEDLFEQLLAAFDAALADGVPPAVQALGLTEAQLTRLWRDLACLLRLERQWPRAARPSAGKTFPS